MGFRLVPKSVTSSDLERRNGHVLCIIFTELGSFRGQLRKSGWLALTDFLRRNVIKYTN